jgi:hypothetical protein
MFNEYGASWEFATKTNVLLGNLSHCRFVHQKSHMTWPGIEPGDWLPELWWLQNKIIFLPESLQLHATAALPPRKEPQEPLGYKTGLAPEPVWTLYRRFHCREWNPGSSIFLPIAGRFSNWALLAPKICLSYSFQLHVTAALPPGKEPQMPFGCYTGWVPVPVWTPWRRWKPLSPARNRIQVPLSPSL